MLLSPDTYARALRYIFFPYQEKNASPNSSIQIFDVKTAALPVQEVACIRIINSLTNKIK
jgi:hypothetical protein